MKKRSIRRIVMVAVLAAATIGGTALAVGTANADRIYTALSDIEDGFDDNPASRWEMQRTSLGGTITFGSSHVSIAANQESGFTAVRRTVTVPAKGRHDCFAAVAMRTMSSATITLNVEVIDPATFDYISVKEVTVSGQEWRGYTTRWQDGPIKPVLFRVAMAAAGSPRSVEVDTFRMVCAHDK